LFIRALMAERQPLAPRPTMLRRQLSVSGDLLVRGAAFQACFLSAAAVAARVDTAALGAHQIALQLWFFSALALDAVAIAAQSLVGASLGSGDIATARRLAWRIGRIGRSRPRLRGRGGRGRSCCLACSRPIPWSGAGPVAWPWFVAMQPLAGVVFALDGVLIGAGDVRYLRNLTIVAALGGFLPAIWLAHALDLGLGGIWAGLTLFITVRLVGMLAGTRNPVGGRRATADHRSWTASRGPRSR
jgi:Na+-driven multidrug efflux pump